MIQDPLFLVSMNLFAAVLARCLKPNLLTAMLLAVVMIGCSVYMSAEYGREIMLGIHQAHDFVLNKTGKFPTWPPEKYRTYPDLSLLDQHGNVVRLSDFKGKVLLVEPMGMSCPACVAFAGGHQYGAFRGTRPQPNLDSIDEYAQSYGGVRLDDPRLVFIQLVLFNPAMQSPTPSEIRRWALHFNPTNQKNRVVLAGTPELATAASRAIIPGFHLIDKNFMLRADSTGDQPEDDLYTDLLPEINRLLAE